MLSCDVLGGGEVGQLPGQAFPVFAIEKVALPSCRCLSFKTVKNQEGGKVSVSLTGISSCRD